MARDSKGATDHDEPESPTSVKGPLDPLARAQDPQGQRYATFLLGYLWSLLDADMVAFGLFVLIHQH